VLPADSLPTSSTDTVTHQRSVRKDDLSSFSYLFFLSMLKITTNELSIEISLIRMEQQYMRKQQH
jgi:hypothetical protein